MKKVLTLLGIALSILFILACKSNAYELNPEDFPDDFYKVNLEIDWIDFDNFLGERPDSIKLYFTGTYWCIVGSPKDEKCEAEVIVKKEDCTIKRIDDTRTKWITHIYLRNKDEYDSDQKIQYYFSSIDKDLEDKYIIFEPENNSGMIGEEYRDNPVVIKVPIITTLNDTYNFTVNWNDDNNRDYIRPQGYFGMIVKNNSDESKLLWMNNSGGDWKSNVWHCSEIMSRYLFNSHNIPIKDKPIVYTGYLEPKFGDTVLNDTVTLINNYNFEFLVNETEVTVNLSHDPIKLGYNIPVKVTWKDEDDKDKIRPEKLNITAYANEKTLIKGQINKESNWEYKFTNLLKYDGTVNGESPVEAKYNLIVDKVNGYTFEIIGNQLEGFEIIATHKAVKNETIDKAETEVLEVESQQPTIQPPKTGGKYEPPILFNSNQLLVIIPLLISTIIITGIVLNKKIINKNKQK